MNVKQRQAENRVTWGQICLEEYKLLSRNARRLANGDPHEAEDLVQDTVVRVLRFASDPRSVSNPLSYLLRAMQNIWRDKRSQNANFRIISLDDSLNGETEAQLPVIQPIAPKELETQELMEQLRLKSGPLTDHERRLLQLYLAGQSANEIARALSADVKIVRYDINALLAKIRYRLRAENPKRNRRTNL